MKKILVLWLGALLLIPSLNAQEIKKYEIGADASFGFGKRNQDNNNFNFSVFGGYKVSNALSVGAGLNYARFQGRWDVSSGIENVYIITNPYQAFRPFVYAHYDFLPNFRWTPYVDVCIPVDTRSVFR